MSGGGGSSAPDNTTNTTTNKPWAGVAPYLKELFKSAQSEIYNNPLEAYGGQTYASFDPAQLSALQGMEERAIGGSPLVGAAQGQLQSTLAGDYLNAGNPYLMDLSNSIGDAVQSQVGSRFAGSGRKLGSPAEVETFQRTMANAIAPAAFENYGKERELMQQASLIAPEIAQQDYADMERLFKAGELRQGQEQLGIDEAIKRFEFQQQEPYMRLQNYASLLGAGSPFQSSSSMGSGGGGVAQPDPTMGYVSTGVSAAASLAAIAMMA